MESSLKILSLVEATDINAVAKNVLEFYRTAHELAQKLPDFPTIQGSIATFDRHTEDQSPSEFVMTARESGLDVSVIPERRAFDLSVIPALQKAVEKRQPDIVITNSVKSHFLLWRSRLWKKYPWVAFHHGYTTTDQKMRLYNRLDRWSLPKADLVVTVCHAFARELASATSVPLERIVVRHNAIRTQPKPNSTDVKVLKDRFGITEDDRVLLSVGRLSKEKAHADLIVAFKHLCETNTKIVVKLVIVGDGPERARLKLAARTSGFTDRIIFAGQASDVQPFYAMADVFVLPSHSEGSPNVLLEAMAAHVPVVATTVGGVPEIVEHEKSALLVPANNPSALAAASARVLIDSDLAQRLATSAFALAVAKHSPEEYARSLLEIYREVIERRSP